MTFPIYSYTFIIFAFRILELFQSQNILRGFWRNIPLEQMPCNSFVLFCFYIVKNNMKNKTFFPPHHRHIHTYQLMIKKEKRDKASSLFQVHSGSLAECLEHRVSSVQFPFILCFVSKALFSIQCFYMTFAFEKAQQPLFPLVRFPSRFIDQSFGLIALVKSAKSSSICQYSWQSDWQWNCYFYGRSMLLQE